jgi:hypothetical protein
MAGISISSKFEDVRLAVMGILRGEQNNVGRCELTTGTSTTVTHPNCAPGKSVNITPSSSGAVTAGAYIPVATVVKGSFVIQHSAGAAGRTFMFELTGGG